jgi:hypothetical protein
MKIDTQEFRKFQRHLEQVTRGSFPMLGIAADALDRYAKAIDLNFSHLNVLMRAEKFISGFEGDELQEGVDELLTDLRAAIEKELPF